MKPRYHYKINLQKTENGNPLHFATINEFSDLAYDEFKASTDDNLKYAQSRGQFLNVTGYHIDCVGVVFHPNAERIK